MAQLRVTADAFYDLSVIELYYGLESLADYRQAQSREMYEIARFNSWLRMQGNIYIKNKPKTPKDVVQFEWE